MNDPTEQESRALGVANLMTLALVREYGSFTRAAEAMGVSQPSVSQQIRELERSAGLPVVVHQGRAIALTPLGEELAEIGHRIAIERSRASRTASKHRQGTRGSLTVGASMTTSAFVVPAIVAKLKHEFTDVSIDLRVGNTFDVAEMVAEDVVDVGVIEGATERPELLITPFMNDEMICIGAPGSRREGTLSPSDVADATLLVREDGSGSREVVLEALKTRGFSFKNIALFGTNETIRRAVAAGIGIAWVSRISASEELAQGKLRELTFSTDRIVRSFSVIRRRDTRPTPLGEAFIERLKLQTVS